MTEAVMDSYIATRRQLATAYRLAVAAALSLPFLALITARMSQADDGGSLSFLPLVAVLVAIVAIAGAAVHAWVGVRHTRLDVNLDASRRWVTLGPVSAEFAAAVDHQLTQGARMRSTTSPH